jgi:hypothetical protein
MLDACLFNSNIRAGTIAHRLDDARIIFRDKVKLPYDLLPEGLKAVRPVLRWSADELEFANNSSIRVSTSMRSGTLQFLHISEYGQLCAKFPEKAREVRTGALNTVQAGQVVFIESTADGHEGHFYELCETAQAKQRLCAPLTPLDFKFNFFPWWKAPEYQLTPDGVVIGEDFRRYFDQLQESHGVTLSPAQCAWYAKKAETQLEDMKREYPSTPDEAFEASVEGAYYGSLMAKAELQGRVGAFDAEPGYLVNTAWDIGIGDEQTIWCFQILPGRVRLVGYYANSGEGLPHYLDVLERMAGENLWTYGTHYMPHDIQVREWTNGLQRIEQMLRQVYERHLGKHVQKVPMHRVDDGINAVRQLLPICQFDAGPCAEGIKALKNYRKEWDEERGVWRDRPRHDAASHGADAFRSLAMIYREVPIEAKPEGPRNPQGRVIPIKSITRNFAVLTEMSYDEFAPLGRKHGRRERV